MYSYTAAVAIVIAINLTLKSVSALEKPKIGGNLRVGSLTRWPLVSDKTKFSQQLARDTDRDWKYDLTIINDFSEAKKKKEDISQG